MTDAKLARIDNELNLEIRDLKEAVEQYQLDKKQLEAQYRSDYDNLTAKITRLEKDKASLYDKINEQEQ